jgi:hypothetical protein
MVAISTSCSKTLHTRTGHSRRPGSAREHADSTSCCPVAAIAGLVDDTFRFVVNK